MMAYDSLKSLRKYAATLVANFLSYLGNLTRSGHRSNAFGPWVLFAGITIPILVFGGYKAEGIAQIILFSCVGFIVLFAAIMYLVIFIKDPKLLQSESYRLEDKR